MATQVWLADCDKSQHPTKEAAETHDRAMRARVILTQHINALIAADPALGHIAVPAFMRKSVPQTAEFILGIFNTTLTATNKPEKLEAETKAMEELTAEQTAERKAASAAAKAKAEAKATNKAKPKTVDTVIPEAEASKLKLVQPAEAADEEPNEEEAEAEAEETEEEAEAEETEEEMEEEVEVDEEQEVEPDEIEQVIPVAKARPVTGVVVPAKKPAVIPVAAAKPSGRTLALNATAAAAAKKRIAGK